MRPRYSGDLSHGFWKRVNRLPFGGKHEKVYALGVALQNLEGQVLRALYHAENFPDA